MFLRVKSSWSSLTTSSSRVLVLSSCINFSFISGALTWRQVEAGSGWRVGEAGVVSRREGKAAVRRRKTDAVLIRQQARIQSHICRVVVFVSRCPIPGPRCVLLIEV